MKKILLFASLLLSVLLLTACSGGGCTEHDFGEWVVSKEPTCLTMGARYRRCLTKGCDYIENEQIPIGDHNFDEAYTLDIPATATEDGEKSRHCLTVGCSERTDITVIPKTKTECTEHDFSLCEKRLDPADPDRVLNLQAAATCISYARYYILCASCGAMSNETYEDVAAGYLPHAYDSEFTVDVVATTVMTGEKSRHCTQKGCTARTDVTSIPKIIDTAGFQFSVTDGKATLTAYTGKPLAHICIPETDLAGNPVVAIGDRAFANTASLMSIVIPSSVKSIGSDAFFGCTSLAAFYYAGSFAEWQSVTVDATNGVVLNTSSLYYYNDKTPPSSDKNNYWYYNKNGVITIYDPSWTPPVS